ncbi:protein roadkill-like [Nasonia vitripennis]|uniref:BTB domain-containing protein n=1 Tax=Nasonia vitripennis TaxID=7425 RepID=A0A7M7H4L3_NASVI|nr:protein roadkill-like [Nasonia vitripennis]
MNLEQNNDVSFTGSLEAVKDELIWIIRSLNPDKIRSVRGIVSQTVFVGCKGLSGTLHLQPNSISEFLSLTVYLNPTNKSLPSKFWAYIKCQLLHDKQVLASSTAVGTFSRKQNYYVFQNFVRPSDLDSRDRVVVCCFINVLDRRVNQIKSEVSSPGLDSRENNTGASRAKNEFKKEKVLLPESISTFCTRPVCRKNSSKHYSYLEILGVESSDVTLVSRGEEFPAHRNILASDSVVFSAMFIRSAEENAEINNRIIINDVNPDVLHQVLRFIYTRKLSQYELVPDVLIAADKYELGKLKTLCERILFDKMSPNNVCGILLLADRYNFQSLKNWALFFISAFADHVIRTPGFQVLTNSSSTDLMAEVYCEIDSFLHK